MGCNPSKDDDEDAALQAQRENAPTENLLLLGISNSGKSTVNKQICHFFKSPVTKEEKLAAIHFIRKNALETLQTVIGWSRRQEIDLGEAADAARSLECTFSEDIGEEVAAVWANETIKGSFQKWEVNAKVVMTAPYFLDQASVVWSNEYLPTEDDLVRASISTCGISNRVVWTGESNIHLIDVGGLRGERGRWVSVFPNTDILVFTVDLSNYDQSLVEDKKKNAFSESVDVFKGLMRLPFFATCKCCVFMTKDDIFRKKVLEVDMSTHVKGYTGGLDYEAALTHIKELYTSHAKDRNIICKVMDATNNDDFKTVWQETIAELATRAGRKSAVR